MQTNIEIKQETLEYEKLKGIYSIEIWDKISCRDKKALFKILIQLNSKFVFNILEESIFSKYHLKYQNIESLPL